MRWKKYGRIAPAFFVFLLFVSLASSVCAQRWSFAAFSDPHDRTATFRNVLKQVKSNRPADFRFPPAEFVLGLGDYLPLPNVVKVHEEVIGNPVPFFPVRGNHERPVDVLLMRDKLLPSTRARIVFFDGASATYYFDWKNIRVVAIDPYTIGTQTPDDPKLVAWVEQAIVTTAHLDHVFIGIHWPSLPDNFHADPFWGMLLRHTDKVRAVFCGHTHFFARRYIPDTYGGLYLVNAGNAGNTNHSDGHNTFVQISVDRQKVLFRAVQAPAHTTRFEVSDTWTIAAPSR